MKESKWKRFLGSWFWKTVGTVLLCVFGAVTVYYGYFAVYMHYDPSYGRWQDTPQCESYLASDVRQAAGIYTYDNVDYLRSVYSAFNSNVGITVEEWNQEKNRFQEVADTIGDSAYTVSMERTYGVFRNEIGNLTVREMGELPENAEMVIRVTGYLREPLLANDEYSWYLEAYEKYQEIGPDAGGVNVFFLALLLIVLLLEFCSAGHLRGEEDIHLTWVDKIPYDVFSLICCIGFVSMLAGSEVLSWNWYTILDNLEMAIVILMGASLVFYLWLMSSATRIKDGSLFRNTVIFKLLNVCTYALRKISWTWRVVLVLSLMWFVGLSLLFGMEHPGPLLLVIFIVDLAAAIAVANVFMSCFVLRRAGVRLAEGNLEQRIDEEQLKHMHGAFREHALNLNSLGSGMEIAVNERMRSERMKTELITNVSHDIKTPLTSIINYVDLLRQEHTPEQEEEYLNVLANQSARLKKLTEDIVEASKASTGNITVKPEVTDVREILIQSIAEYQEKLSQNDLEVVLTELDEQLQVMADGRLLWRVLSNVLSNVVKYAMPSTRVYVGAERTSGDMVCISVKNISSEPLNISADELMQRFVRGDASRHTEGSGLGLSIARSLTELQNGTFGLSIDGDLFRVDICLPQAK